jgi:hypothetical protein
MSPDRSPTGLATSRGRLFPRVGRPNGAALHFTLAWTNPPIVPTAPSLFCDRGFCVEPSKSHQINNLAALFPMRFPIGFSGKHAAQ